MAIRTAEAALVIVAIAWVIGCGDDTPVSGGTPTGETRAEGTWAGGFSTSSTTLGPLQVTIDNAGKIVAGVGGPIYIGTSEVKSGVLRADGLLEVYFRNGSSYKAANAVLSQDGSTITGSGTFRAPDGSSETVFITLYRQIQQ